MCKICIDGDLENVVGGLHTPFDDEQTIDNKPVQENDKMIVDENRSIEKNKNL